MKRRNALPLILAALLPLSASRVLQRPPIRHETPGARRSLLEAKHEYPVTYIEHESPDPAHGPREEPNPWHNEEPNPWDNHVAKEPKGAKGSKGVKPAHPVVHTEADPHPWHDPHPWDESIDSSDEDAWGEYIAGHPGATKPSYHDHEAWYNEPDAWVQHTVKGTKGPKGEKGAKGGGEHPIVHKDKASKGKKPVPQHAKDPVHHYPEPHPVSKDTPNDPTDVHGHSPNDTDGDESVTEKRVVIPLVLQFSVKHARIPTESELHAITAQTDVFLSTYLDKFFDEYIVGVELDYFSLVLTEGVDPIVDGGIISLEFTSITFFETIVIPSDADMAFILEEAFLNENLNEYLRRVNTLPSENVFASTTEVSVLVNIPDKEDYKLIKSLQEEEAKSIAQGGSTSKLSLLALITMIAAAALIASAVALVAYRRKRLHNEEDDLSFVEGVFVGDKDTLVEQELGDDDFEVSSCSSSKLGTRAENFLRLVARDEDDGSGNSTFRIEMGGNKAFSRA